MGLLDIPAPLYGSLDRLLALALPTGLRLVLWGLLTGAISMALYWLLSPQDKIAESRQRLLAARQALDTYDGDFGGAAPLLRSMLHQALRQLFLVAGPALVAMLPVFSMLAWMSTSYGYYLPSDRGSVSLRAQPDGYAAQWADDAPDRPSLIVRDGAGREVQRLDVAAPVPVIHKRQWWNALAGNPAGYLTDDAPLDLVEIGLPQHHYLPFGPSWLRGWEAAFILMLSIAAVTMKRTFRIH